MTNYPNLFSPLRVNSVMLKNRIIAAPMGVPKATVISSTNYGGISVYDKALGGAAVVTVGDGAIASIAQEKDPFGKYARDVGREIVTVLRQSGGLAMCEIPLHGDIHPDGSVDGPSDGTHYTGGLMRGMSKEDMQRKIEKVAKEAKAVKDFGFDMVMLHFGHDSLCSVFLSPVWNQRTDEYGGTVENRSRFAREALRAIREAVGKEYPIMMRVSRELKVPESFDPEDMLYFLKSVEDDVDIINVSCGMDCYGGTIDKYVANTYSHSTIFLPRMHNLDFAARVKKEVNALVCVVGGVSDPKEAEQAIAEGKTDAVMMGRQLIADPFWPRKAQNGKEDEIVPCLRCLNCYHISTEHTNTQCSVNPRFRRENRVPLKLEKTAEPKKVVVIGGGPAGMKAALTAEEKGHRVVLVEKEGFLGGNLKYADHGDFKDDLKKYRDYLIRHITKSNIEVQLNTEATPDYIRSLCPDALIVAVGADFVTPRIPGAEHAVQAVEVFDKLDDIKGKVVVIGGGAIGSEVALELSNRNADVTVVEMQDALAKKSNWLYRHGLYNAIKDAGNKLKTELEVTVKEIRENGVVIVDKAGEEKFVEADTVLLSIGMRSRKDLAFSFYGITPETAMVGDCHRVGQVLEATNESYFIASNL